MAPMAQSVTQMALKMAPMSLKVVQMAPKVALTTPTAKVTQKVAPSVAKSFNRIDAKMNAYNHSVYQNYSNEERKTFLKYSQTTCPIVA